MIQINRYIGIVALSFLLHLYFYNSESIKKFDYKSYDFTTSIFKNIQKQESGSYSVIIDIDEKSLYQLGQWPWPRVLDAKLIDIVDNMNPSAIGINILFPEEDRVSITSIQKFYKNFFNYDLKFHDIPEELKDNDKILAQSILKSKTTLSTYFSNENYTNKHCQNLLYKDDVFSDIESQLQAPSLLCNTKTIQDKANDFGFINAWEDSDGIFRRAPLFMRYREHTYPSFALATLLSFDKYIKIDTRNHTLLLNFSTKKSKIFSAVDIFQGKIPQNEIQGKIVIIGSSVVGLNPTYTIANGDRVSNNIIHATAIDNILSNTFLTQPEKYKKINIIISFILSIIVLLLFIKKAYLYIITLFFATTIVTTLWLIDAYRDGIYISIGYLWLPLISFSLIMLIYHMRIINQEQIQQEKLLIRQNKLASMGEMISLIAHQWRQPLSAINGVVISLDIDHRKNRLDSEKIDKYLNEIEELTAYLSKTINDFTSFFSINKKQEKFYIADIVSQAQNLSVLSKHTNIELIYNENRKIALVGLKSELLQSLLIVINNAIYACQKNITNIGKGRIVIKDFIENNRVYITIEDNGGGIEKANLKKIFNPYFTTKSETHGTGLGLYILKMIVEDSMNGRVTITNTDVGAKVTIDLSL